jgi:aspartyl protease family protein
MVVVMKALFFTLFMLASEVALSAPIGIEVVGLFKDRAAIVVEGKRHFVRKGEVVLGRIKLLSSTTQEALFEVDGVSQKLKLGNRVGGYLEPVANKKVVIWRSPSGMFATVGSINGFPVNFLVDTGATKLALNRLDATHFGVVIDAQTPQIMVSTASGRAPAFFVKLNKVRVGDITLRGVEAIIMDGSHPKKALLGMSFLKRTHFNQNGQTLTLTEK